MFAFTSFALAWATPAVLNASLVALQPAKACHSISPSVSDGWCKTNCNHDPPDSPSTLCACDAPPPGPPAPPPPPTPPGPAPTPAPLPASIRGYYSWNWGTGSVGAAGANCGTAFTGLVDVMAAQQAYTPGAAWCCPALALPRFLSLGGGNSAGQFTLSALQAITRDAGKINRSQYEGVMFDVRSP